MQVLIAWCWGLSVLWVRMCSEGNTRATGEDLSAEWLERSIGWRTGQEGVRQVPWDAGFCGLWHRCWENKEQSNVCEEAQCNILKVAVEKYGYRQMLHSIMEHWTQNNAECAIILFVKVGHVPWGWVMAAEKGQWSPVLVCRQLKVLFGPQETDS